MGKVDGHEMTGEVKDVFYRGVLRAWRALIEQPVRTSSNVSSQPRTSLAATSHELSAVFTRDRLRDAFVDPTYTWSLSTPSSQALWDDIGEVYATPHSPVVSAHVMGSVFWYIYLSSSRAPTWYGSLLEPLFHSKLSNDGRSLVKMHATMAISELSQVMSANAIASVEAWGS